MAVQAVGTHTSTRRGRFLPTRPLHVARYRFWVLGAAGGRFQTDLLPRLAWLDSGVAVHDELAARA
jgi:hypothetical protein